MKATISVKQVLFMLILLTTIQLKGQIFTEQTGIVLPAISNGSTEWGDYDNDGDLDILITGDSSGVPVSHVIRNMGSNTFSPQYQIKMTGVKYSATEWCDLDNDGYLDIILTGSTNGSSSGVVSKIYRNTGSNNYNELTTVIITGVYFSSVSCGDYDNDGDFDILLTGLDKNSIKTTKLYRNGGSNNYTEVLETGLVNLSKGSGEFGDYDNDGYLDIIIMGDFGQYELTKIYRNNGNGTFTDQTSILLPGIKQGTLKWGDANNDGYIDFVLAGSSINSPFSRIYRNNKNNTFSQMSGFSITSLINSSSDWGDYDNDGDLDLLIAGESSSVSYTKIYKNNGNSTFSELTTETLAGIASGSVKWGDYDNDGDLDIMISGKGSAMSLTKVYKNTQTTSNIVPATPASLTSTVTGTNVVLKWRKVTDDHTPSSAVTYNIRVGTSAGGINLASPNSLANGYRKLAEMGNGQHDTTFILKNLRKGTYYWSVQAIDQGARGGSFATESQFTISADAQASGIKAEPRDGTKVKLQWTRGNGANCIVFLKAAISGTASPSNTTTYTANQTFGLGSQILSTGWYCVYKGMLDTITVRGLTAKTNYICHVIEFNGSTGSENYLTLTAEGNPFQFTTNLFSENPTVFQNFSSSGYTIKAAWGDYDNDNDLDLLISGSAGTEIYANQGNGSFIKTVSFISFLNSSVSWGDYDNDGFLDILLTGTKSNVPTTSVFRNNGNGTFTEQTGIQLPGISDGNAIWCDYDNDGDPDVFITGGSSSVRITKLYQNLGANKFIEVVNQPFAAVTRSWISTGDLDNDGYPDAVLTGHSGTEGITRIYRNQRNGSFTEIKNAINEQCSSGTVSLGDINGDGLMDILLAANSTKVYKNNGDMSFSLVTGTLFPSTWEGDASLSDCDNDGDLDIMVTGGTTGAYPDYKQITKIYLNDGSGIFTEMTEGMLPLLYGCALAWGDYDKDGDLDLFLTGNGYYGTYSKLYRNEIIPPNSAPTPPAGLSVVSAGLNTLLKWNRSSDNNTPVKALTYNIRIGTTSQSNNIKYSGSGNDGLRRVVAIGNTWQDTSFFIRNLPPATYFWSVQAIDNAFSGGPFSSENQFIINPIQADSLEAKIIEISTLNLHWKRGNGEKCIVFCKQGTATTATPVNNTSYMADNQFGFGSQIGTSGWFCLYNGRSDSVVVKGLSDLYNYTLHVIEYSGSPGSEKYFTQSANANPGWFASSLFTDQTDISISGSYENGSLSWADFNKDNFLDMLIVNKNLSQILINNGNNTFTQKPGLTIPAIDYPSVSLADYDKDGDIDILVSGLSGGQITKLYNNNGDASFTERSDVSLPGTTGSVQWGDFDNDGDADFLITGSSGSSYLTNIYKNNNGNFSVLSIALPGATSGSASWIDYDNDGDLDLHLTGYNLTNSWFSEIYTNKGMDVFVKQPNISLLSGPFNKAQSWGDYNNDGKTDILMAGGDWSSQYTKVFQNISDTTFAEQTGLSIPGVGVERVASRWVDYDNDGDFDILVSGYNNLHGRTTKLFQNNGNWFSEVNVPFIGVSGSTCAWGDYDNDGDQDLILSGYSTMFVTRIYKNNTIMKAGNYFANRAPEAPVNLSSKNTASGVFLKWDNVKSDETNYKTITYNLRVGTTVNGVNIISPHSDANGNRQIVSMGNAQLDTTFLLRKLASGKYYWQVQAVDQGYRGGSWSVIDSFKVKNVQTFFSSDEVCLAYPTHFTDQSVAADGIASWKWDFKDGSYSSSQNPEHTYSSSGTYSVKLVITDINGVKDSLEQNVIVKPKPVTAFSVPVVCQGTASPFTNSTNNNGLIISSWFWDFGDGQTSILQQPPAHGYLGAADYTVQLKALASNGCRDSITKTVTVASYPVAVITSSAALTFCKGDSVTLSVTQNNDYLYKWKLDGALITETGTNKLVAKLTGNYTVDVINSKGNCITVSSPVTVTAQNAPTSPTITYTGNLTFCQGDSIILSVSPSTGNTYQWKLNGGAVGSDTNRYVARNTGIYNLILSNSTGCSAASANSVSVSVKPAPLVSTINQVGETKFCKGKSAVLSVPANSAYTFSWKKGITFLGITSNSVTATESGDYSVEVTTNEGCIGTSDKVTIEVIEPPSKPSIDKGSYRKGMCLGENPIELKVDDIIEGNIYKWYKNEAPVSNSTSIHITEEGNYYLEAGIDICTSLRDSVNIDFMETLPKPVIDAKGPIVWYLSTTSAANYYKWYYNGAIIPDAESKVYLAKQNFGLYRLAISSDNICYSFSDTLRIPYLGTTGIENPDPFADVKIYPNPTTGVFTIEMNNNVFGELVIDIITQNGSKILNIKFDKSTEHFMSQIDLSGQPNGMFLINLSLDKFRAVRKVLVE